MNNKNTNDEIRDYYRKLPVVTIQPTMDSNVLSIRDQKHEMIFNIKSDGTVETFGEKAEEKAAKLFYENLQIEGKTLHQRIADLKSENEFLKIQIDNLKSELIINKMNSR